MLDIMVIDSTSSLFYSYSVKTLQHVISRFNEKHYFSVILFNVQIENISSIKIQLSTNISNWTYYFNKSPKSINFIWTFKESNVECNTKIHTSPVKLLMDNVILPQIHVEAKVRKRFDSIINIIQPQNLHTRENKC